MSVPTVIETLKITAVFKDANQQLFKKTHTVDVLIHKSPIKYHLPVSGSWFMRALPGIESHHRLNASTEFAVDFFKLSEKGRIYEGDSINANNYLGYGQSVKAAADGKVVHVESNAIQDRQAFKRKEQETPKQRGQRLQTAMFNAIKENPRRAFGGNLITIKHEQNGVVEYSSYGHLKTGSIKVNVGDNVRAGQAIAEVGDTGDSPEVHLHFQVNTGPDAFMSQSLPFTFDDIKHAILPAEPGFVVRSE
jgi:murein DD-endopeptidase MepM/ murein hydrolase activator NlpD